VIGPLIAAVAAVDLNDHPAAWPREPLDPVRWSELVAAAERERVVGLLAHAIHLGRLPVADEQRAAVHERHLALLARALEIEDLAAWFVAEMRHLGVGPVILKGLACAHLDYGDPSHRAFHDLDVLVEGAHIDRCIEALVAEGHDRGLPPRSRGWDGRFAKDVTVTTSGGVEIDVHRTLVPGAFGTWLDLASLHRCTTSFRAGPTELTALGADARALHAALALTVGEASPRLSHARDLAQLLHGGGCDPSRLAELADASRARGLVRDALRLTASRLGTGAVPAAFAALSHPPRDRWPVRAARRTYRSSGGSNSATLIGGALAEGDWRTRVAHLRPLVLPDRRYRVARRRTGRPNELRTGVRELLGRRR